MTKVGLILFTVFLGMEANAQFTGQWRGTGNKTNSKTGNSNCSYIGFTIGQSTTSISVSNGQMICGGKSQAIPSISGSINKKGQITYWGIVIGTINASRIYINTTLGGGRKVLDLNRIGNQASFYFNKADSKTSDTVQGNLFRSSFHFPHQLLVLSDLRAARQDELGLDYIDQMFGVDSIALEEELEEQTYR